ncbi:MAG: hypothetical protein Q8P57_00665 [Candidatus Pacearchaeota archaeon]|nr:hypothetical protein [Candidatus Pacearchaeota archaeon]
MVSYENLYEFLRKEKYSEQLQKLPADFVKQFSDYLCEHKRNISKNGDFFSEEILSAKKEYENSMIIFSELILRRKKKILNLVFVAAETGVMKKDFDDLLPFEKDLFERLVLAVDDAGNSVNQALSNCSLENLSKEVVIQEDVEEFVDMFGEFIGPFKKGQKVSLDGRVADVLISGGKAEVVG